MKPAADIAAAAIALVLLAQAQSGPDLVGIALGLLWAEYEIRWIADALRDRLR